MAQHSRFSVNNYKKVCGLQIMPLRTSFDGPASITKEQDIIDEAFDYFRVNVLFSSYEIKSGADVVLIYLLVMIGHLFKITDNEKTDAAAKKRILEFNNEKMQLPKDAGFFMNTFLENNTNEIKEYMDYIKQLKKETSNRFLEKFYQDGVQIEDYRLWAGIAKRKFMGFSYTSSF